MLNIANNNRFSTSNYAFFILMILVMVGCLILVIAVTCDLSSMLSVSMPVKQAGKFVLGKCLETLISRGANGINSFMESIK